MDNFLERNLIFLPRYNQELADKIANLELLYHHYALDSAESANAIMCIDGLPANSTIDPNSEVGNIFMELPHNEPDNFYVIAGIEIGYLFDCFVANCKGYVIIYEPWIDSLRVAFELIDFSRSLRKDKVFIVTNLQELDEVLTFRRKPDSQIHVCANKFYEYTYKNELAELQNHIASLSAEPEQRAIF
ncbi:MAG: hypothetical protein WCF95_00385 [bacterium]